MLHTCLLSLFVLFLAVVCCTPAAAVDARFILDPSQLKAAGQKSEHTSDDRKGRRTGKSSRHTRQAARAEGSRGGTVSSVLQLAPHTSQTGSADLLRLRQFWDRLVPPDNAPLQPLVFKSDSFDLVIDPLRYPLMRGADGSKLLLDRQGTLPPLVRTLLQERDPSLKIVTASADERQLLASMLGAGGFYSVEEQPVLSFGQDPRLRVRGDFKIERTGESVLRNDLLLVSAARQGMPPRLTDYLKGQGFVLLEPFADQVTAPAPLRHRVVQVAAGHGALQTVDLLLDQLALPVQRNSRVELFRAADEGIGLSVAVERSFERAGRRYLVARFSGDPIAYTLVRLLETKGYQVIILDEKDGFQQVAGKLLDRIGLPARYSSQLLLADPEGRYTLEMSGFLLENSASGGGSVMLTDRPLDRSMRELLYDRGYLVQDR